MQTSSGPTTLLDVATAVALAAVGLFLFAAVPAPFLRCCLVGSAILATRGYLAKRPELYSIAGLLPVFIIVANVYTSFAIRLTPHTIDAQLLAGDRGIQAAVAEWFGHRPAAYELIRIVYFQALPIWAAIVLGWSDHATRAAKVMAFAAVPAMACSLVFPAVGPVWFEHGMAAHAPRNCLPSLHFSWALMLAVYAPRRLRIPAAIFAAATGVATLAVGEHYVIDLVVAIPFTAAIVLATLAPMGHAANVRRQPPPAAVSDVSG